MSNFVTFLENLNFNNGIEQIYIYKTRSLKKKIFRENQNEFRDTLNDTIEIVAT